MAKHEWPITVDSLTNDELALAPTMAPSAFIEQVLGIELLDY